MDHRYAHFLIIEKIKKSVWLVGGNAKRRNKIVENCESFEIFYFPLFADVSPSKREDNYFLAEKKMQTRT